MSQAVPLREHTAGLVTFGSAVRCWAKSRRRVDLWPKTKRWAGTPTLRSHAVPQRSHRAALVTFGAAARCWARGSRGCKHPRLCYGRVAGIRGGFRAAFLATLGDQCD
jgi:hypothetical protein